ncbi:hypothetical protein BI364_15260 [Acidihalobacter yilgarnensis]|uniref:Cytochrome oxidase subunit II copper A binding domain-containing protein n=1 Tax=Acidihalobacter yilgarnensis TaxID=2819280 RepID=A0A1D8IRU5_9GAMM|nr:hypothetical protein [Acidihalobacter yilgarnensis]AOU99115.1 hypothetical protein BI364_15260 [Acidihalobacter yilgarnensis]
MKRNLWRDFINVVIIWAILIPIAQTFVFWSVDHLWPAVASLQGEITKDAITFIYHVTVVVFILVTVPFVYAAIVHRVPLDDKQSAQIHRHAFGPFTLAWLGISIMINTVVFVYPGMVGLEQLWNIAADAKDPLVVDVTGQQWQWSFSYPKQGVMNSRVLEVPVDQPIKFIVKTDDVMHSFWVPIWGIKQALVPGETRSIVITPTEEVTTDQNPLARVQCSWDCGLGHAQMRAVVKVVSDKEFKAWVANQSF